MQVSSAEGSGPNQPQIEKTPNNGTVLLLESIFLLCFIFYSPSAIFSPNSYNHFYLNWFYFFNSSFLLCCFYPWTFPSAHRATEMRLTEGTAEQGQGMSSS